MIYMDLDVEEDVPLLRIRGQRGANLENHSGAWDGAYSGVCIWDGPSLHLQTTQSLFKQRVGRSNL